MAKKFAIEKKLIKPIFTKCYTANMEYVCESSIVCWLNDWHVHRKYDTEKKRDMALQALKEGSGDMYEYRKKDL